MIQLPHPKTHETLLDFARPQFLGQVKMDGTRLALVYGEECEPEYGVTKNGMKVPAPIVEGLPRMHPGTVVDGELLGQGTWQSAQSELRRAFLGERVACSWVAFDLLMDPLNVAGGFRDRVEYLDERGFPIVPTGGVQEMWDLAIQEKQEGVVVRAVDALPLDPSWKIKRKLELNVVCIEGRGMLIKKTGQPHVVCSLPVGDGMYRVACEGVTSSNKLRAARVIGNPVGQSVSYDQLLELR